MISLFWSKRRSRHLSARIRGKEISEFLGYKTNPKEGFENDVCVYVKPNNLDLVERGWWVDVLDGGKFVKKLNSRPDLRLIACTQNSYDYLEDSFPNEIVLIPHQHLNWERYKRDRTEVTTCGYIGSSSTTAKEMYKRIGEEIKKVGFDFVSCFRFKKRKDATDFYKKIDILVIGAWELGDTNIHKIPTKIINAASFGIPAVAYPLEGYKEIEGYYTHANNMEELVSEVSKFKDAEYYNKKADGLIEMAEKYHISNVAKLYEELK